MNMVLPPISGTVKEGYWMLLNIASWVVAVGAFFIMVFATSSIMGAAMFLLAIFLRLHAVREVRQT